MCIPSFGLKYFLVLLGTSTLLILSIHLWPNWVHGPLSVYTYCSCELTHCWQFPNLYPPSGPLPSTPDFYCQQPTQFLHLEVKHNVLKTALGYPPQTNHSQRALAQWMATPLWHTIALSPLPQSWLGNPIGRSYLQNKSGPFLTTSSTANSITWVPVSTLDHPLPFSYSQHSSQWFYWNPSRNTSLLSSEASSVPHSLQSKTTVLTRVQTGHPDVFSDLLSYCFPGSLCSMQWPPHCSCTAPGTFPSQVLSSPSARAPRGLLPPSRKLLSEASLLMSLGFLYSFLFPSYWVSSKTPLNLRC